MTDMTELKSEATSLGIKYNPNIGQDKLQEKIDTHYSSQETSGDSVAALVKANEKTKEPSTGVGSTVTSKKDRLDAKIKSSSKAARKTKIVKIVDNDQRQNNHTTTCTVNCSNQYFDLGTRILPLNENIEVAQGHLNVLKEVKITLHTKDARGLSAAKQRNRYSISTEEL